jgi:hypothetical protein
MQHGVHHAGQGFVQALSSLGDVEVQEAPSHERMAGGVEVALHLGLFQITQQGYQEAARRGRLAHQAHGVGYLFHGETQGCYVHECTSRRWHPPGQSQ